MDVASYLEGKGCIVKPAAGNNVHTHCLFCSEAQHKRGRLYVSTGPDTEGLWYCHKCGSRGNLTALKRHFGDAVDDTAKLSETHFKVFAAASRFYHNQIIDSEAMEWLKIERGLNARTIAENELGFSSGHGLYKHLLDVGFEHSSLNESGLFQKTQNGHREALAGRVTIPYHVAGNVVTIRGVLMDKDRTGEAEKYKTLPGAKTRLFGTDVLWNADEAVICAGEFDAMLLTQLGFKSVGVPGEGLWQKSWNSYFPKIRRVYVVFDPDETGTQGAQKVKDELGPKARIVQMPEGATKNDPTEWIVHQNHTKEDFQKLLDEAAGGFLITVDEAYQKSKDLQNAGGLKLGYETLDSFIAPGLRPHQVAVIYAREGTGKSLFLISCFHNILAMDEDKKILFCSLELTAADWYDAARKVYRFHNLDATDVDFRSFYRDHFMIVEENRLSKRNLLGTLEDFEYELGQKPDLLCIDYLGYFAQTYKGDNRYIKGTDAIMDLKSIAKSYGIPILVPHQVSAESEHGKEPLGSRDGYTVRETADFAFGLWNPDNKEGVKESEREGVLHLKIQKSRHGNQGRELKFQWAPLTLAIVPIDSRDAVRARSEVEWQTVHREDFEGAIYRHQKGGRLFDFD